MHKEILSENQKKLLDFISVFKKNYYLVGGTAIALHIGHRESVDFDLFSISNPQKNRIKNLLEKENVSYSVLHEAIDQIHLIISNVKLTFFNFPFNIEHNIRFENYICLPDLIHLAAMKAFALGGRAKWKDYIDLYFILKNSHPINLIEKTAKNIFGDRFNVKLFRQQLTYFADIDYSEPIIYVGQERPTEQEVKDFLTEQALIEF